MLEAFDPFVFAWGDSKAGESVAALGYFIARCTMGLME